MATLLTVNYFSSTMMRIATAAFVNFCDQSSSAVNNALHFRDLDGTKPADEILYSGDAVFNTDRQGNLLLSRSLHDESDRNRFASRRKLEAENPMALIVMRKAGHAAVGLNQAQGAGMVGTRRFPA